MILTPVKTNTTPRRLKLLPVRHDVPLDRVTRHLVELELILLAGRNLAEASALRRIRGDLQAVR